MKKILFIEDESALQRAVAEMTKGNKEFSVHSALNGEDGVRIAGEELPDLILLDLILPRKDGFEVLAELKKDKRTAHIPVIILTNLEGSQDVERAIGLGATTYLVKTNYDLGEVLEKIRQTLGISRP